MKEINSLKRWIQMYEKVEESVEELEVLFEFFEEGEVSEEEIESQYVKTVRVIEDVEFHTTLDQPEDEMSAILEINAGAGGTEANDWAEMLMRMFLMYADKKGYKVKELNRQDGDEVGIKSIALDIDGYYAFDKLNSVHDNHCIHSRSALYLQFHKMYT